MIDFAKLNNMQLESNLQEFKTWEQMNLYNLISCLEDFKET